MIRLAKFLRDFKNEERGAVAVETVIIIPMLFWVYLSMFAIFDAYRQHSVNSKAAYSIGDIVSRETTPVDAAYINGVREMLAYLTVNDVEDVAVRLTSVFYDEETDEYKREWSEERGWMSSLSNSDVDNLRNSLPVMPDGEHVMVVETFVKYDPPFNTGLSNREIHNFVFTRPRYAPQVLWSSGS